MVWHVSYQVPPGLVPSLIASFIYSFIYARASIRTSFFDDFDVFPAFLPSRHPFLPWLMLVLPSFFRSFLPLFSSFILVFVPVFPFFMLVLLFSIVSLLPCVSIPSHYYCCQCFTPYSIMFPEIPYSPASDSRTLPVFSVFLFSCPISHTPLHFPVSQTQVLPYFYCFPRSLISNP